MMFFSIYRREVNTFDSWDSCLVLDERNTREHSCSVLGTKKKARDSSLVLEERNTIESIVVRFWVQKRRPGIFVRIWTKGTLESIVVRFWVQKRRPGIVVWIWTKGTLESIVEILRNLLFFALACIHNVCLFGTRLHITG
jgi:hypothetical protein